MDITKRNFKKVLRELDLTTYPSLDVYLKQVREKLIKKQSLSVAEELMSFPKLKKYFDDYKAEENRYHVSQINLDDFAHRPPKPFQVDGIKFLLLNNRCILADDMGLGKSIQAILASLLLPENSKVLIITMKSLKYNIEEEIRPYSDSFKVIEKKWETGYKFTIVHYDSVKKWKNDIIKENYDCVILDECHLLKSPKIARSKNVAAVIKNVNRVWLLTGTPMSNRPIDYYNLLKIIGHPITKNWVKFIETYCDGKKVFGHWETKGASNLEDLYKKTKSHVLRRLKKDILKDLPNKDRSPIYLHLDTPKEYEQVIEDYKAMKYGDEEFHDYYEEIDIAEMTKFILWRQYCAFKKIEDGSLVELVENQIAEGNKIVIFTNFTKVVDTIYETFGEKICRFIDGRVEAKERVGIVNEFNANPNLKVLVCNLRVGSVGLNIQSANIAIINDMDWVPSTMLQAEDRLWRIGQTQEVTILYPVYKGTVEEIVFNVVNNKMKNITEAIEGKRENYFAGLKDDEVKETSKSVLKEIFSKLDFLN